MSRGQYTDVQENVFKNEGEMMFDEKLLGYVVLSCVLPLSGQRGKGTIEKILRGSGSKSIRDAVENFHLEELAGILRHIPQEKVREIIDRLMNKSFLYAEAVQVGTYNFPMIFISEVGQSLLASLKKTEESKLEALRHQAESIRAGVADMTREAMHLDNFLMNSIRILDWVRENHAGDGGERAVKEALQVQEDLWEQCVNFYGVLLLVPGQGGWYEESNFSKIYSRFQKGVRSFLGEIPEKQAAAFRARYHIEDEFYHPPEALTEYYGILAEDLQELLKRVLNKFFSKRWNRKYWFVRDIMKVLFGDRSLDSSPEDDGEERRRDSSMDTYGQTLLLYEQGNSPEEIAGIRGLKKSTILSHFAQLIPEHGLDPYGIVPREKVERILAVAEDVGRESLGIIKQNLPEDYEYGEIRIALSLYLEEEEALD